MVNRVNTRQRARTQTNPKAPSSAVLSVKQNTKKLAGVSVRKSKNKNAPANQQSKKKKNVLLVLSPRHSPRLSNVQKQADVSVRKSKNKNAQTNQQPKKKKNVLPVLSPRHSPRLLNVQKQENNRKHVNLEKSMDDCSYESIYPSPATDLYNFEQSEENLKLFLEPEEPTTDVKLGRSAKSKCSKRAPKRLRAKVISFPKPQSSKCLQAISQNVHLTTKDNIRITNNKPPKTTAFDSGIFMTPSPIQATSTLGLLHHDSKVSSTPATLSETKTHCHILEKPLVSPPDVSPVKQFKSPNAGSIHGVLVTSSTESLSEVSENPIISAKYNFDESPFAKDDFVSTKTLDISNTYKNISDMPKQKKKLKSKKASRYSISKYEAWADKKATEFDEIESYELSIEEC